MPPRAELYKSLLPLTPSVYKFQRKWEALGDFSPTWQIIFSIFETPVIPIMSRNVFRKVITWSLPVGHRVRFLHDVDTSCPRCGAYETLEHCFFTCPVIARFSSRLFGLLSSLGYQPLHFSHILLCSDLEEEKREPWFLFLCTFLHEVWQSRNAARDDPGRPGYHTWVTTLKSFERRVQELFVGLYTREKCSNKQVEVLRERYSHFVPWFSFRIPPLGQCRYYIGTFLQNTRLRPTVPLPLLSNSSRINTSSKLVQNTLPLLPQGPMRTSQEFFSETTHSPGVCGLAKDKGVFGPGSSGPSFKPRARRGLLPYGGTLEGVGRVFLWPKKKKKKKKKKWVGWSQPDGHLHVTCCEDRVPRWRTG